MPQPPELRFELNQPTTRGKLKVIQEAMTVLAQRADQLLTGAKVTITDPLYNGQPHGRSKPSLVGKEIVIVTATASERGIEVWDGDYDHCFLRLDQIKFRDE